jgi:hypothetical protein
MTNSILNPIVSLDPFVYVSGREISNDANALTNLGKMQNFLHANYGAGVVIEQNFDDGIFYYNSVSPKLACFWRIPVASVNHKTFRVNINARAHTGLNFVSIKFTAGASNNTLSFTLTPSATAWYSGNATLASISNSTQYIDVELTVSGHLQVNSICVETLPLSSVDDGAVYQPNGSDYFYPVGDTTLESDKPLSSAKGRQLLSNLRLLQKRPRSLFCASGIDVNADGGTTNSFNAGSIHPQKTFSYQDLVAMFANIPNWEGSTTLALNLTIHLYVVNPSLYDYVFFIWSGKITVSAGETGKWLIITGRYPDDFGAFIINLTYQLTEFKINPKLSGDILNPTLISSPIKSISMWGS